jgi:CspA family cold shock protein
MRTKTGPCDGDEAWVSMSDKLTGIVSWFSATKGFGFVKPSDGSEDVFLHATVLQQFGIADLRDGSTVTCEVVPGKKGRQASLLIDVDESTAQAGGARPSRPARSGFDSAPRSGGGRPSYGADDESNGPEIMGVVKWFNGTKGFGFITPDSGGKDVFLHASVLRRAGLNEVEPGQRVRFTSVERDKGPEARSLNIDGA